MKHIAFSMIPKANDRIFNGNNQHPNDPKSLHFEITNEENAQLFLEYQGYCSL